MDQIKTWLNEQRKKISFWRTFDKPPLRFRTKETEGELLGMAGVKYNPFTDMVDVRYSRNGYVDKHATITRQEYLSFVQ